mmetsp:Transcript_41579/g.114555  ORF Transcript_41579/g.114555 Transcript_41579/m.114555 type:complete len:230 (-) Transcript_41579:1710-2399(-)
MQNCRISTMVTWQVASRALPTSGTSTHQVPVWCSIPRSSSCWARLPGVLIATTYNPQTFLGSSWPWLRPRQQRRICSQRSRRKRSVELWTGRRSMRLTSRTPSHSFVAPSPCRRSSTTLRSRQRDLAPKRWSASFGPRRQSAWPSQTPFCISSKMSRVEAIAFGHRALPTLFGHWGPSGSGGNSCWRLCCRMSPTGCRTSPHKASRTSCGVWQHFDPWAAASAGWRKTR